MDFLQPILKSLVFTPKNDTHFEFLIRQNPFDTQALSSLPAQ